MIFPVLETEDVVQVADKTRLDASKSFVSKDSGAVTMVEIRPEATGDTPTPAELLITFSLEPVDGSYALFFNGIDTATVQYNATAAELQTALRMSDGLEQVTVTGDYLTHFRLVLTGVYPYADGDLSSGDYDLTSVDFQGIDMTITLDVPYSGTGAPAYVNVTGTSSSDWYLDWVYTGDARTVTVSARVTTAAGSETVTKTISIVTAASDKLFSNDQQLVALESDILKWVPAGRSSFLNVHRAAQTKILEALDESGVTDTAGSKLTKAAVVDISEVSAWSRDMTLALIFASLSNAIDDVFERKSKLYWGEAAKRKQRAVIRLDLDGDGEITKSEGSVEGVQMHSMTLIRS